MINFTKDAFCFDSWAMFFINNEYYIEYHNEKAQFYFPEAKVGQEIYKTFSWFRKEWLEETLKSRVVKTSSDSKMLMDIIPFKKQSGYNYLLFKKIEEYRNLLHLWCEIEDSLILLQPFIDNSHDGIIITNRVGKVRAINNAFSIVSGLKEDIIGKTIYELCEVGLLPECSMMSAIKNNQSESSVVKFPHGKETVISSNPLFNEQGQIIRILSNVRDITELKDLHEKLKSTEAIAKHYQRELNAKITSESNLNLNLQRSRKMEDVYELVKKVADTDLPLLLMGESGIGKTALAKQIHTLSERNNTGTFVHINCSAIPEMLLESELFGYESGAFTGAKKAKIGLFEIANRGTLFFDEIGDMPFPLQAKLLNVLQEKKFYRVGGTKTIDTDVRVLSATNQNLEQLITLGKFRHDLYFRLNVIPITIPPLRERKEDIASLIAHFLEKSNQKHKRSKVFSIEALEILLNYDWPGNIREMINVVERLVVLTKENVVEPIHLSAQLTQKQMFQASVLTDEIQTNRQPIVFWTPGDSLKGTISKLEEKIIEDAIMFYGSVKEAAKRLSVDESTITRKRSKFRQMSLTSPLPKNNDNMQK